MHCINVLWVRWNYKRIRFFGLVALPKATSTNELTKPKPKEVIIMFNYEKLSPFDVYMLQSKAQLMRIARLDHNLKGTIFADPLSNPKVAKSFYGKLWDKLFEKTFWDEFFPKCFAGEVLPKQLPGKK